MGRSSSLKFSCAGVNVAKLMRSDLNMHGFCMFILYFLLVTAPKHVLCKEGVSVLMNQDQICAQISLRIKYVRFLYGEL